MRFSHVDHIRGQIQLALLKLTNEDQFSVSRLAELAGCSESLIYQWTGGKTPPRGDYIFALMTRLAAEYSNYRLLTVAMPSNLRLSRVKVESTANGSMDDEIADLSIAGANLALAHRGSDPDGIAEARASLREIDRRAEAEETLLRSSREAL